MVTAAIIIIHTIYSPVLRQRRCVLLVGQWKESLSVSSLVAASADKARREQKSTTQNYTCTIVCHTEHKLCLGAEKSQPAHHQAHACDFANLH